MSEERVFDLDRFEFIKNFVINNTDTYITIQDKVEAAQKAYNYALKLCTTVFYDPAKINPTGRINHG